MAEQLKAGGWDGIIARFTRASDLSGIADSKSGALCWEGRPGFWLDDVEKTIIGNESDFFRVYFDTDGKFRITAKADDGGAGATLLDIWSDITLTWHMGRTIILAQWDTAAGVAEINVNGIDCLASGTTIDAAADLDYTRTGWAIGSRQDGTLKFAGEMRALWLEFGTTFDFDTAGADISKFVDTRTYLDTSAIGADGSTPTGNQPPVYFLFEDPEESPPSNLGDGGSFVMQGALYNQWWPEPTYDVTNDRYVHHDDTRRPFILNENSGIILAEDGTAVLRDNGLPL